MPPFRLPPSAFRLFLAGYRGTGKTTVGRHLADALGWPCVDTDDLIEQAAGKSIAAIFADEGEPAFRDLEQRIVADACRLQQTVVALGGGAVLREASRRRIAAAGPVVWLTARPEAIAARLSADVTTGTRRPNLTADGGLSEIERVLAERTPVYRSVATIEVDTQDQDPVGIAGTILRELGMRPPLTPPSPNP